MSDMTLLSGFELKYFLKPNLPLNATEIVTRVEAPEVISAEERCFIVLTFFSADSENMINISAVQN